MKSSSKVAQLLGLVLVLCLAMATPTFAKQKSPPVGATGPTGPIGATGPTGATGATGPAGTEPVLVNENIADGGEGALNNIPAGSSDSHYGSFNTAMGARALYTVTTGNSNTAFGFDTLIYNNNNQNCAFGLQALRSNLGTSNVAIGLNAMGGGPEGNASGDNNTAIGTGALFNNNGGGDNVAIGSQALSGNTTGAQNTATGYQALYNNTTGYNNTATGLLALYSNTTGYQNTAVGFEPLELNTTGANNIAIGIQALSNNTSGGLNIVLGFSAGSNLTTGNLNIDIGNVDSTGGSSSDVAGESNTIRIGHPTAQTATFIAGINGVNASAGQPVFILPSGQLGTGTLALASSSHSSIVPARLNQDVKSMKANIAELKSIISKQEKIIAKQRDEIQSVAAQVKEQQTQIRAVNQRLEQTPLLPMQVDNDRQ
jgi:hypothetical protein